MVSKRTQIGVLVLAIAAIMIVSIWNLSNLASALSGVTKRYAEDVSHQLADDINVHLDSDMDVIELMADAVFNIRNANQDENRIQDILIQKAKITDFDYYVVIGQDGSSNPVLYDNIDLTSYPAVLQAFQGKSSMMELENEELLFVAPIRQEDGIKQVLVGVMNQKDVQELIRPLGLKGEGLTCIVDGEGNLVIEPGDESPFWQMPEMIDSCTKDSLENQFLQVKNDMTQKKSGVCEFISADGKDMFLSYQYMDIPGWFLLSLISADMMTSEISRYMMTAYVMVGIIIFLLILPTMCPL